jgi:hypothetical protein
MVKPIVNAASEEQFNRVCDRIKRSIGLIREKMEEIGLEILSFRKKYPDTYPKLHDFMRGLGLTESDIKSLAYAGSGGRHSKTLFFNGVRNSKVFYLTEEDKEKLAAGPVDIIGDDGSRQTKHFDEMTGDEKNRLFSNKGGSILSYEEQVIKKAAQEKKEEARTIGLLDVDGGYIQGEVLILTIYGRPRVRVSLSILDTLLADRVVSVV